MIRTEAVKIIQRAYKQRLMRVKDGMTFVRLMKCVQRYNDDLRFIEEMNKGMNKKKIRNPNFPSHISENIAKLALCKKYKVMPNWDCKGDLTMLSKQLEIKGFMSSGPLSFGPAEPWDYIYFVDGMRTREGIYQVYEIKLSHKSEEWRNIVMSGKETKYENCNIPENLEKLKVEQLKELCSQRGLKKSGRKDELIYRIKNEEVGSGVGPQLTYGDIADADKRGKLRAPFHETIKPQISDYCQLIFDGHITELA